MVVWCVVLCLCVLRRQRNTQMMHTHALCYCGPYVVGHVVFDMSLSRSLSWLLS